MKAGSHIVRKLVKEKTRPAEQDSVKELWSSYGYIKITRQILLDVGLRDYWTSDLDPFHKLR